MLLEAFQLDSEIFQLYSLTKIRKKKKKEKVHMKVVFLRKEFLDRDERNSKSVNSSSHKTI